MEQPSSTGSHFHKHLLVVNANKNTHFVCIAQYIKYTLAIFQHFIYISTVWLVVYFALLLLFFFSFLSLLQF